MHSESFFSAAAEICAAVPKADVEKLTEQLAALRERGGRLFLIGVGGSAGNCSHATNDFRKLCGIEAYAPVDNVSELTARANDEGWETIFSGWLEISRLDDQDAILIFSVGGGDVARNVSVNIVRAIDYAKSKGAKVFGIVGKETGYTAQTADVCVVVPALRPEWITPLSEAFQAVVWHCIVSNPKLQVKSTKW
jgi:D-sedoheptulose 7-phosphate isomerase